MNRDGRSVERNHIIPTAKNFPKKKKNPKSIKEIIKRKRDPTEVQAAAQPMIENPGRKENRRKRFCSVHYSSSAIPCFCLKLNKVAPKCRNLRKIAEKIEKSQGERRGRSEQVRRLRDYT